ncbi:endocuticle structural glycoprotein SgAbd-5-like [Sabethes cyaneus]|uniref:endocuticle structural glycoprotein SgAbd-5-like n=1 Tax=Sabethes cyaneus TaxID=53552 RepID=UPI00237D9947|nr:endocuticle structural glycoprotein SgAbd-5-like [Sabethes cyaneus]
MKFLIVFTAIVAVALAASADEKSASVVKFENDHKGVDGYNIAYETSNGIAAAEQALLKTFGDDAAAIVVKGNYKYTGADGVVYSVNYVADENGFQPEAAHLPRA